MIRYDNIQQKSLEWLQVKWAKIGGTRSSILFKDSDAIFNELFSELTEEFQLEPSFTSDAMERGNELEPFARNFLNYTYDLDLKECGWLQSEINPLLGISPDGISDDNKIACEIKCLGRKKHSEILINNQVPIDFISQIVHYFVVNTELEFLYFIAYRPEAISNYTYIFNRGSFVNIGTKAKPVIKQIDELAEIAHKKANQICFDLQNSIDYYKNNLPF
jgi:hypothetical protein